MQAALASADPAEEAWHWSSDHTVGASYRRQAHEDGAWVREAAAAYAAKQKAKEQVAA